MELTNLIREQQIRLLHKRTPAVLFISLVVASGLTLAVWIQTNSTSIFFWLLLVYVFLLFRVVVSQYFIAPAGNRPIGKHTEKLYIFLSGLSGLVWASCLLFAVPETLIDIMAITILLCCMMAGAVSGLSYVRMAYIAYVVPVTLSVALSLFILGDKVSLIIGTLVIFYMFACMYFGNGFNRVLVETLRLQHENRELLENLKLQRDIAEKANVDKSRFLAAASHDLRQPLHSLNLFINALETKLAQPEHHVLFNKITLCIGNLEELFNSLLDISKLDAGVIDVNQVHFNISETLNILTTEYESQASHKKLAFNVEDINTTIYCDKLLLQRILKNLLNNALAYTREGHVAISFQTTDSDLVINIEDTGAGIPEQELSNIFIEFHQLNNPERDGEKGLGLGLAIVKRLCDLLKLDLNIQSVVGKGSTFSVNVPLGDEKKIIVPNPSIAPKNWQFDGLKVLVVDDEKTICDAMQTLLSDWGCDTQVAEDIPSVHAVLTADGFVPDIVICDYRLRDNVNGLDIFALIKAQYKLSPAYLLISGDTSPENLRIIAESGYTLLHKPAKPSLLRRAIFNLTRQPQSETETV